MLISLKFINLAENFLLPSVDKSVFLLKHYRQTFVIRF